MWQKIKCFIGWHDWNDNRQCDHCKTWRYKSPIELVAVTDLKPDDVDWLKSTGEIPNRCYVQFDFGEGQPTLSETIYYDNGDVVEWPSIIKEETEQ